MSSLRLALFGVATLFAACVAPAPTVDSTSSNVFGDNGLSNNGLGRNGLGRNGLGRNGLGRNGLGRNGIGRNGLAAGVVDPAVVAYLEANAPEPSPSAAPEDPDAGPPASPSPDPEVVELSDAEQRAIVEAEFNAWFAGDASWTVDQSAQVMKYLVRCACPEEFVLDKPWPGREDFVWHGLFGRAPNFCAGAPLSSTEKRAVSACMAAMVNPSGLSVPISFRGVGVDSSEAYGAALSWRQEGAFFGNLDPRPETDDVGPSVPAERIYACSGSGLALEQMQVGSYRQTTVTWSERSCAVPTVEEYPCDPVQFVGPCADVCAAMDEFGAFTECSVDGREYRGAEIATVFLAGESFVVGGDELCDTENANLDPDCYRDMLDYCGDGICSQGEAGECASDCGSCGDGVCSEDVESPDQCPADCQSCESAVSADHLAASPDGPIVVDGVGGSGEIAYSFSYPSSCEWSAHTSAPSWLAVSSDVHVGSDVLSWSALPNTTCAERSATILVGSDLERTVRQAQRADAVAPALHEVPAGGAWRTAQFTTCSAAGAWRATSPVPWIVPMRSVLPLTTGGTVILVVRANSGAARDAVVHVGDTSVTVRQAGVIAGR